VNVESKIVTLDTINGGAVVDLFEEELTKLLKNIADDNTDAGKVRSISIKLSVKPSSDRSKADTKVEVTSRLAPLKPHESFIVLSSDGKSIQAFTTAPVKQQELPGVSDNVREFPGQQASGGAK
jgi:hypothetical protein